MNATTVLSFVVAMVFVVGGLLLMGYSFETPGFELIMFSAGAVAEFIGVAIPALLARSVTRKSSRQ
ncbi:hypothetical protein [Agrococcus baldri]|uniref:Uncharacterized protein n=1 Tax=Agrococcus baldri TaxID=153730 RepID=A0AA87RHQ0_9MICO|nr:hypothetical protein [Agrococcus baldri]GEK80561.1 hypothetical protein ABA31_19120 [Agrococcus baldri]